jgi:hypothetical protein
MDKESVGLLKGVDVNYFKTNSVAKYILHGDSLLEDESNSYSLIGIALNDKLNINYQNKFESLSVYVPKTNTNVGIGLNSTFEVNYLTPRSVFSVYQEFDDKTMYENNKDLKATNPQIAKVVSPNPKYGLQKGDLVFVHYLQYSTELIIDGIKYIPFNTIFFKINGKDDFEMADDTYLAKQILIEAPKTSSGIFLSSLETKKEPLRLTVTHAPRNAKIGVGNTIITEDDYQYEIEIYGEKYVKITPEWIAATMD